MAQVLRIRYFRIVGERDLDQATKVQELLHSDGGFMDNFDSGIVAYPEFIHGEDVMKANPNFSNWKKRGLSLLQINECYLLNRQPFDDDPGLSGLTDFWLTMSRKPLVNRQVQTLREYLCEVEKRNSPRDVSKRAALSRTRTLWP